MTPATFKAIHDRNSELARYAFHPENHERWQYLPDPTSPICMPALNDETLSAMDALRLGLIDGAFNSSFNRWNFWRYATYT